MRYSRIFLIVLDSVGIGNANDAEAFGDLGANTIGNISQKIGLHLPNLEMMGLGNLGDFKTIRKNTQAIAYHTYMRPQSAGKDSIAGHWEMMGCTLKEPFKNFCAQGFPAQLIKKFEQLTQKKVLGNKEANGLQIIHELGEEHIKTKNLIVYTSVDSTFQIAAHEKIIPIEELYQYCKIARQITLTQKEWKVARIIARPFVGNNQQFVRTENRKDYAIDPYTPTVLDIIKENNLDSIGIGKISDLYNGKGISKSIKTHNNADGIEKILDVIKTNFKGLAFLNLVDFDSSFGHPRNVEGYKDALEYFDVHLTRIIENLDIKDLLMITADHGNDPTYKGNDHTRENVPLIIFSKQHQYPKTLEARDTFADIGKTIIDNFNLKHSEGKSFLNHLI